MELVKLIFSIVIWEGLTNFHCIHAQAPAQVGQVIYRVESGAFSQVPSWQSYPHFFGWSINSSLCHSTHSGIFNSSLRIQLVCHASVPKVRAAAAAFSSSTSSSCLWRWRLRACWRAWSLLIALWSTRNQVWDPLKQLTPRQAWSNSSQ